jgi:ferritin-like metal-binding protein YciE
MKKTSNVTMNKGGNNSTSKVDSKTKSSNGTMAGKAKAKSNAADGLRELFVASLKDIYWAELHLVKELPKIAKNATTPALIDALKEHTTVTQKQVERLEKVFELIGEKAVAKKCDAMEGLLKEGQSIMEENEVGAVRDAGIILASQKIEHYEIATYGTLCAFAKTLGEEEVAAILAETLEEEKEADTALTNVAYHDINFEAAGDEAVHPDEDEDDFLNDETEEDETEEDDMEEDVMEEDEMEEDEMEEEEEESNKNKK